MVAKRPLAHVEIFSGDDVPTFIEHSRNRAAQLDADTKTLLQIESGATLAKPQPADLKLDADQDVLVAEDSPDKGHWTKARRADVKIIARSALGTYSSKTHSYANGKLFLDTMVGSKDTDTISYTDYKALSKADQAKYPRRKVLQPKGDPLWLDRSALGKDGRRDNLGTEQDAWSQFPLQATDTRGPKAAFARVQKISALEKDTPSKTATDTHGTRWWQVSVGQADGTEKEGWACEQGQDKVSLCSPWDWPGFETVAETATPSDLVAHSLMANNEARSEEKPDYKAVADKVDGSPLFKKLRKAIDLNKDQQLSRDELRKALRSPWKAQTLSHLIVRYESEWGGDMAKWDALDKYMKGQHENDWTKEKERIKALQWWSKVNDLSEPTVYHFHPVGLIENFLLEEKCACGCCLGSIFNSTRYGSQYGPVYWGSIELKDYKGWKELIASNTITTSERDILVAMSENEGKMDAIQSYDSEILTAGAMQKTINSQGAGEFPIQVHEFKKLHPRLYKTLFYNCGWEVKEHGGKQRLYYEGKTGSKLKQILRNGFDKNAFKNHKKIASSPLAVIVNAVSSKEFKSKQVIDFVKRLRYANSINPDGHTSHKISDFIHTRLGKALILDQHVNRPSHVARDFGSSLDSFFLQNPKVSKNPSNWKSNHAAYEDKIIAIYGPSRDMTDAKKRYNSLKGKL